MATKSKNTDLFTGLVSWLCLCVLLCAIPIAVVLLLALILNADMVDGIALAYQEALRNPRYAYEIYTPLISGVVLTVAALVPVFAFRKDRLAFQARLAQALARLWLEVKLAAVAVLFFLLIDTDLIVLAPGMVILFYLLCLDISHNRQFFRHNIIHSLLKALDSYKSAASYEKRLLRRTFSCMGVAAGVLLISAFIWAWAPRHYWPGPMLGLIMIGSFAFAAAGVVGAVAWYVLSVKRDLRDWNALMAQITEMYGGNLNAVNRVPPTSNLYDSAMQLNMIRTGIEKAVEEGTKADRTKVELITNVSHDIKTPLTSIISYIELLKKEPDLPDHVMDYIRTISNKADRLSHIVQDVFEISKAATGNISLNLEDLDIGKLLQQTFGEMDETLQNSQLIWRMDIPEGPVLVHADGQRLYRVFQNLIRNCDQYALEGSRAYVSLSSQNGQAVVSIRNVSKNEITMDGSDLTARFVRGDQNRTTEGSGLGLSIAKSFTEACGGRFQVHTDGDLFVVTVQFPQVFRAPVLAPPPLEPEGPPAAPAPPMEA